MLFGPPARETRLDDVRRWGLHLKLVPRSNKKDGGPNRQGPYPGLGAYQTEAAGSSRGIPGPIPGGFL